MSATNLEQLRREKPAEWLATILNQGQGTETPAPPAKKPLTPGDLAAISARMEEVGRQDQPPAQPAQKAEWEEAVARTDQQPDEDYSQNDISLIEPRWWQKPGVVLCICAVAAIVGSILLLTYWQPNTANGTPLASGQKVVQAEPTGSADSLVRVKAAEQPLPLPVTAANNHAEQVLATLRQPDRLAPLPVEKLPAFAFASGPRLAAPPPPRPARAEAAARSRPEPKAAPKVAATDKYGCPVSGPGRTPCLDGKDPMVIALRKRGIAIGTTQQAPVRQVAQPAVTNCGWGKTCLMHAAN